MFGHKSFLRIGALNDSSISGLYKDSYELENCNFGFMQNVDSNGKPQTEVHGGTISLTYSGLPQQDLLRWALGSTKYEDGAIVTCNDNNEPLEKVFFEHLFVRLLSSKSSQKRSRRFEMDCCIVHNFLVMDIDFRHILSN